jgi:hypothetical protein
MNFPEPSAGTRPVLGGEFFGAVVATLTLIETRPEIGTAISTDGQGRSSAAAAVKPWESRNG